MQLDELVEPTDLSCRLRPGHIPSRALGNMRLPRVHQMLGSPVRPLDDPGVASQFVGEVQDLSLEPSRESMPVARQLPGSRRSGLSKCL